MSNFMAASNQSQNPNKSFELNSMQLFVTHPPNDSISSLSFSPKSNILVATSWDNQVLDKIASVPKASISHDQPVTSLSLSLSMLHETRYMSIYNSIYVLCSAWKDDGSTVFSGGCDKQVKMWPLAGNQPVTVAMHDAPIKEAAWIPEMNYLVTGSWDKTLKYWDLRQQTPIHTQALPECCYTLSLRYPLMVVGTADRNLIVFNLQNPQLSLIVSPLKYHTRCVAAFPDQQGFLVGSIEGRVGVHHLDDGLQSKNFTFKCHREGNDIYSVKSLNFHPVHHTFATAGSDGSFNFWDKDSKRRLKVSPISIFYCYFYLCIIAFNSDGSIFAYAVCYDWSKGAENHNPATAKNFIYLHVPHEAEVKGKPRINTGKR
ncbi:unnamed protein product [Malus baccata var. baccata]